MTTDEPNVSPRPNDPRPAPEALLIPVADVAALLNASERTVWRLADSGKMPRPVALGRARRWNRKAVESWIAEGCPVVRPATRHIRG